MMNQNNTPVVVSLSSPALWQRDTDETWMLNPRLRYILQAKHVPYLEPHIATVSELKPGGKYRPFYMSEGRDLPGKKILIERGRECGIGDLLFMTGPLSYLHHITGGDVEIDFYALNEKAQVLDNHPALTHKAALRGPLLYDALDYYDYHWLLPSVTEYSEEPDQLNVYDAIYSSIGLNYKDIDPRWKRPNLVIPVTAQAEFNTFCFTVFANKQIDLRKGYFVIAPHAYSSLRTADYRKWIEIIRSLAPHKTVVIVGGTGPSPDAGISYGQFLTEVSSIPGVLNLVGATPMTMLFSLIQNAVAVLTLDTGPLYIAQALRTPAISIWGPNDPKLRLRYDSAYLKNAVWTKSCTSSPCNLYRNFSETKCPSGLNQGVCANLQDVPVQHILNLTSAIVNGET